ncbi:MAG: DNA-directed RNA polymerase subunit omega [Methylococcales bacterium]
MARVTIEDCLENIENRFKLVLLASKRARQLSKGADAFVPRGKDKDTVLALREIAAGHVNEDNIELLHQANEPVSRPISFL